MYVGRDGRRLTVVLAFIKNPYYDCTRWTMRARVQANARETPYPPLAGLAAHVAGAVRSLSSNPYLHRDQVDCYSRTTHQQTSRATLLLRLALCNPRVVWCAMTHRHV